jgi:hypothetical protein
VEGSGERRRSRVGEEAPQPLGRIGGIERHIELVRLEGGEGRDHPIATTLADQQGHRLVSHPAPGEQLVGKTIGRPIKLRVGQARSR